MTQTDIRKLQEQVVDSLSEELRHYPPEVRTLLRKMLFPPQKVVSGRGGNPLGCLIVTLALGGLVQAIRSGDSRAAMNGAMGIGSVLLVGFLVVRMMDFLSAMRDQMRMRKVRRILRALSDAEVSWLTRLLEPKEALALAKRLDPTTIRSYLGLAVPLRMACLKHGCFDEVGYV